MQAYKFETSVLKDGVIKIPEIKDLVNHEIIIFIVTKETQPIKNEPQKIDFTEFSKRWRGFLKNSIPDDWRNEYTQFLEEKYQ